MCGFLVILEWLLSCVGLLDSVSSPLRDRYYDLKPADLGELVKLPRMGKTLHRLVHQFPRVELAASVQPITRALLRVELTITPDFLFDQKVQQCIYLPSDIYVR